MNEKVEKFLETKRKDEIENQEKEKKKTLFELGLYEKEYSPNNLYTEEYSCSEWDYDSSKTKYYKKVPVEITEEEYQEVKKYAKPKDVDVSEQPTIVTVLTVIAWIIFTAGFIAGIALGNVEVVKGIYYTYTDTEFSFAAAMIYWSVAFISGTMFLGFAEIIKLLDQINKK